jgi:hypothetical protein
MRIPCARKRANCAIGTLRKQLETAFGSLMGPG